MNTKTRKTEMKNYLNQRKVKCLRLLDACLQGEREKTTPIQLLAAKHILWLLTYLEEPTASKIHNVEGLK